MSQPPPAPRTHRTSRTTRILLGVTLVGGLVFLGSTAAVLWQVSKMGEGDVKDASFLKVRLNGQLTEAPPQAGLFINPEDAPPTVTQIAEGIRAAATDDRITGLYLDLDDPNGGWGATGEIRDAISDLRAAGKPCIAYAESYDTKDYWLVSECDRILLAPGGLMAVNGMSTTITYFAGTLEKIGAVADFEHVGDFKSAVEPFQRAEPSEPASEAMNYLLDGLWQDFVADVAKGREVPPERVADWVNHPTLAPDAALASGFIDGLVFRDAVQANITSWNSEGWVASLSAPGPEADREKTAEHFTSLSDWLDVVQDKRSAFGKKIAVVYASGQIVSGRSDGGLFGSDGMLADKSFQEWMRDVRDDESIEAVVLRIDSPGGSGLASDMMWREVQLTKAAGKPVVVSMGDYAASGGYYIAAPADWIVAQEGTLTGSIGVFGGKIALSGTWEKLGMTAHTYKRGEEADLLNPTYTFSEGGRAAFRVFLQDFYDRFLGVVAEGRKKEVGAVHDVAQGRVWTGRQALERGLVDELGGLDEALRKAAELAELEEYGTTSFPRTRTFLELLQEDLEDPESKVTVEIPGLDLRALEDLAVLERVLEGNGVAAMLPARIEIE